MRFPELSSLVHARNDMHRPDDTGGQTGDGRRVREATQSDIRKFLG